MSKWKIKKYEEYYDPELSDITDIDKEKNYEIKKEKKSNETITIFDTEIQIKPDNELKEETKQDDNNKKEKESASSNSSSPPFSDSSTNHYPYSINEIINGKYRILKHISNGTFGSVFKCENIISQELCAMKIISPCDKNFESAEIEAKLTQKITEEDKKNQSHCVKIFDHFKFSKDNIDYYAIVIELLGLSLYEYLKNNSYNGYTMSQIQDIAYQTFEGIAFLHKIKMIHTDLKPENILLVDSDYDGINKFDEIPLNIALRNDSHSRNASTISTNISKCSKEKVLYKKLKNSEIKIIDFGSAVEFHERGSGVICTRQYRPPEVILDCCQWDEKSDVWAIGCILVELYTGELLFPTYNNQEQLCLIEKTCGHYPNWMIKNTRNENIKGLFVDCKRHKTDKVLDLKRCSKYDDVKKALANQRTIEESICPKHGEFGKFLQYLLKIDPKRRPSASDALKHHFFRTKFVD